MKICNKNYTNLRKQKLNDQKKEKIGVNARPFSCKIIAISIVPRHQVLNLRVKFIVFNIFAHEILPVDAVWGFMYEEFKDIFEGNKQGFDGKSCT